MKYCEFCGNEISEEANFCVNCGEKVIRDNLNNNFTKKKIRTRHTDFIKEHVPEIIYISIAIIFLLAIGNYCFKHSEKNKQENVNLLANNQEIQEQNDQYKTNTIENENLEEKDNVETQILAPTADEDVETTNNEELCENDLKGEEALEQTTNSSEEKIESYTVDNLPDGVFIKEGDVFYPIIDNIPDCAILASKWKHSNFGYGYGYSDAYYIKLGEEDVSIDVLSVTKDTVFAMKGDNISTPEIEPYYTGYTYDAVFTSNDIYSFSEGEKSHEGYRNVEFINDIQIDPHDYSSNLIDNGAWAIQVNSAISYNWGYIFLEQEKPTESIKYGWFEGTNYKEEEVTDVLFYLTGYDGPTTIYLEKTQTMDGYFEYRLPADLETNCFYGIFFWETYSDRNDPYLIYLQ